MSSDNSMENCEYLPLTSVLKFIVDNRGKSAPTTESGFPLIATNCIKNNELYPVFEKVRFVSDDTYRNWFRAHPKPGDIIFVNKGTPGRVCLVPDPVNFCIAQDMMSFRVNEEIINNQYLFAVLRSPQFQTQIENHHVGTLIPHFKKGDLDKLMIPIPSRNVQRAIGKIYFDLSYKIELNNRMNKVLEQMAQAIFKQWFVDFEFPNEDGAPYKSSGGEMEWCEELGKELPKGWRSGELSELIEISSGKRPSIKSNTASETSSFPIVGASSVMGYTTNFNYNESILVIGRVGTHGIVQRFNSPVWASDNTLVIKSLKYEFVFQILQNLDYKAMNRGSTQPLITQTDVKGQQIIIPVEDVLNSFETMINTLYLKCEYNNNQNAYLNKLRDTLLPKLMSGELDVSEIEL